MKKKYEEAIMDMCVRFGQTSSAERLKVGCLIYKNESIISMGVNGQPSGWHTEVCEGEDGLTLPTVRHAEQAALDKLLCSSESTIGATMFVSHAPCLNCSLRILGAKITKVIYKEDYRDTTGIELLRKYGVEVEKFTKNT